MPYIWAGKPRQESVGQSSDPAPSCLSILVQVHLHGGDVGKRGGRQTGNSYLVSLVLLILCCQTGNSYLVSLVLCGVVNRYISLCVFV